MNWRAIIVLRLKGIFVWIFLVVGFWGFYHAKRSPLSYISITGKIHFTTNDIICKQIETLDKLGTILTQDINIIQQKIECLPWIQKAIIRKQWPDILKIHIVEHIPIAFWNTNDFLSDSGIIFHVPEEYKNYDSNRMNLVSIFSELEGNEYYILINYYIFNAILSSNLFQIKSITVDTRYAWELILNNNMHLKLGRDNFVERLLYFIRIYPFLLKKIYEQKQNIDYIDLRYDSGFAVKWISNIMHL